jgi:hypothetical protein
MIRCGATIRMHAQGDFFFLDFFFFFFFSFVSSETLATTQLDLAFMKPSIASEVILARFTAAIVSEAALYNLSLLLSAMIPTAALLTSVFQMWVVSTLWTQTAVSADSLRSATCNRRNARKPFVLTGLKTAYPVTISFSATRLLPILRFGSIATRLTNPHLGVCPTRASRDHAAWTTGRVWKLRQDAMMETCARRILAT